MRPAISDSLISGQPLYLLYSNASPVSVMPAAALFAALAWQATGKVRLHVTGSPPTCKGPPALEQDQPVQARTVAAAAPSSSCLRWRKCTLAASSECIYLLLAPAGCGGIRSDLPAGTLQAGRRVSPK